MSTPQKLLKWIVLAVLLTGCQSRPSATADPSATPADKVASWPRFHGPNSDNLSRETGLLKEWPEDGPKLGFVAKGIGEGFAGVTIADGLMYTCGNIDRKTMITALDLDGNIKWQVENGRAWTGDKEGTRGTPTIDGNRLYHESPLGEVVCLDAKTGDKVWGLNILEKFGSNNIRWALAESLLVDGDRVICCPGGPETAVVALDKKTGRTVWKSPSADGDLAGYSSPSLAEYQGLRMVLVMTAKAVIGVGADGGDLLFRFPHKTSYDVNALMPIFHNGHVFVSTGYGAGSVMLKLNVAGDDVSAEEVWRSRELDNHHGGVILLDGYLYGSSSRGRWVCLDWKTGETMYSEGGVGKGSLTYADGMLYTLSEKYKMGLVKATPEGHQVISQFMLPEGGEGPSWAHPVVCGGRLYVRHGDFLYAYDVREAGPSGGRVPAAADQRWPQVREGHYVQWVGRVWNTRKPDQIWQSGDVGSLGQHNGTGTYLGEDKVNGGGVEFDVKFDAGYLAPEGGGKHFLEIMSWMADRGDREAIRARPSSRIELANLGDRPRCLVWNYGPHFRGRATKIFSIGPAFQPDRWYHVQFRWSYREPAGRVAIHIDDRSYSAAFEFVPGTVGPGRYFLFGHVETTQPEGRLHFRNFRVSSPE